MRSCSTPSEGGLSSMGGEPVEEEFEARLFPVAKEFALGKDCEGGVCPSTVPEPAEAWLKALAVLFKVAVDP